MRTSDTFRKLRLLFALGIFIAVSVVSPAVHAEGRSVQATVCAVGAISGVSLVANTQDNQALQISGSVTQAPYVDVFIDGQKRARILTSGNESDFFTTVAIMPGTHLVQAYIYDACTDQNLVSEVEVIVAADKKALVRSVDAARPFVVTSTLPGTESTTTLHRNFILEPTMVLWMRDLFSTDFLKETTWILLMLLAGIALDARAAYIIKTQKLLRSVDSVRGKHKKKLYIHHRRRMFILALCGVILIVASLLLYF